MPRLLLLLAFGITALAQPPVVRVEVFGNRNVSAERILKTLQVKPGDPLPAPRPDLEDRVEKIKGVSLARAEAFCCEDKFLVLYVGIEEAGGPHLDLHFPTSDLALPPAVQEAYEGMLGKLADLPSTSPIRDNWSLGYSIVDNEEIRAYQIQFIELSKTFNAELRQVLRESADDEQRAAAAYILGYAPKEQSTINDLQYALRDGIAPVRHAAMRALVASAVSLANDPAAEAKVQPTWLVANLASPVWNDRLEAARALTDLTTPELVKNPDPTILPLLRERAVSSLTEIASWQNPRHALPGFLLLARVAGFTAEETEAAWQNPDREPFFREAKKRLKKKS